MREADGLLTLEGRGYLALSGLLVYPIDVITKVFDGAGAFQRPKLASFDFGTSPLRFELRTSYSAI